MNGIDDFIDAVYSERTSLLLKRIILIFLSMVIGIGMGYAWAYKVFG